MIAPLWFVALRPARALLKADDSRSRRVTVKLVVGLVRIALPVYLLPALLAVLVVGGFGIAVLAVASAFTDSTPGPRGRIGGAIRAATPNYTSSRPVASSVPVI